MIARFALLPAILFLGCGEVSSDATTAAGIGGAHADATVDVGAKPTDTGAPDSLAGGGSGGLPSDAAPPPTCPLPSGALVPQHALEELGRSQPSLYRNVCDETGAVRRHINIFVNTSHMRDREGLDTLLAPGDAISILPAVSGG